MFVLGEGTGFTLVLVDCGVTRRQSHCGESFSKVDPGGKVGGEMSHGGVCSSEDDLQASLITRWGRDRSGSGLGNAAN